MTFLFSEIHTYSRLAQSVEHETLNLRVVGSSPTLGECFVFFFYYLSNLMIKISRRNVDNTSNTASILAEDMIWFSD